MVIDIPLPPNDVARLRERATKVGKSVEQVVADVVVTELAADVLPVRVEGAERARVWEDWLRSLPPSAGVAVDDSREAIYGDDGR